MSDAWLMVQQHSNTDWPVVGSVLPTGSWRCVLVGQDYWPRSISIGVVDARRRNRHPPQEIVSMTEEEWFWEWEEDSHSCSICWIWNRPIPMSTVKWMRKWECTSQRGCRISHRWWWDMSLESRRCGMCSDPASSNEVRMVLFGNWYKTLLGPISRRNQTGLHIQCAPDHWPRRWIPVHWQ